MSWFTAIYVDVNNLSHFHIAGLAQDYSISSALAMAIVQSCTKSSISFITVYQECRHITCPSDLSTKADFEDRVIYQHCATVLYVYHAVQSMIVHLRIYICSHNCVLCPVCIPTMHQFVMHFWLFILIYIRFLMTFILLLNSLWPCEAIACVVMSLPFYHPCVCCEHIF